MNKSWMLNYNLWSLSMIVYEMHYKCLWLSMYTLGIYQISWSRNDIWRSRKWRVVIHLKYGNERVDAIDLDELWWFAKHHSGAVLHFFVSKSSRSRSKESLGQAKPDIGGISPSNLGQTGKTDVFFPWKPQQRTTFNSWQICHTFWSGFFCQVSALPRNWW